MADSVEGLGTLAQGDCGTLVSAFSSAPCPTRKLFTLLCPCHAVLLSFKARTRGQVITD